MKTKLILMLIIIFIIVLPISIVSYAENNESLSVDTKGHWAEDTVSRWSQYGILKGSGGNLLPDEIITRAQLASVLNKLLRYPKVEKNPYVDVKPKDWFYDDMLAMSIRGIVRTVDGKGGPNELLVREEAVYMIAHAIGIDYIKRWDWSGIKMLDKFKISKYAQNSVFNMEMAGFIQVAPDGRFYPMENITCAEVITIIDHTIDMLICEPGEYKCGDGGIIVIACGNVNITDLNARYVFITPGIKLDRVDIDSKTRKAISRVIIIGWSANNIYLARVSQLHDIIS